MLLQGSEISDVMLNILLREMGVDFPDMGEVMVLGGLRALGYRATRDRVRRCIRATDPLNTALQGRIGPTHRRPYSVPGPNSLWHIGKSGSTFSQSVCLSVCVIVRPFQGGGGSFASS